jgi:cholest-4-en-3-one 26-monooxygenase
MTQPPAGLGIDLMSGEFFGGDPFGAYAWMRAHAPVYHDERNDLWALTRHADVKSAGTDPAVFSSAGGIRPKFPPLPMMIDFDAPEHSRRRKLVSAGFTPRRVKAMEDHIRAVCDDVIDAVCERGECDFVRDIAAPLPLNMIGDLLGVARADRPGLLRWSEDMLRSQGSPDPDGMLAAMQAFAEYTAYMGPVFEGRRRTGADGDLVGALVHAEIGGDRLDHDSLIHESLLILVGGDETTRHVLSGGMLALLQRPAQLERLRADPGLLPAAVEEMLRWVSRSRTWSAPRPARSSCTARGSRRARRSCWCTRRPTGTRRSSPGRRRSTRRGSRTRTWRSASARTSAWATSSPGWSCG